MSPLGAWNRFWFGLVSARPLGMFRILFGGFVLVHLALSTVDLDHWYTDAGLLRGNEARLVAGPLRLSPLQWIQDPVSVRIAFAAIAAVAAGFTVGWRTRVMSMLLYLGLLSLYHRNISTICGLDQVMMITSFYLMLSPCGAALSLDARRLARKRGGTPAEPLIVPWAQRLIQIQLCVIYFDTAVIKCQGTTWLGGTALHYVLFNHEFGQFNLEWLTRYPLVVNVLTLAALLVEFALAFLLWFRPTRRWVALAGLALHAVIVPLINVPLFGEQMTATYLLFLDPDELDGLFRALDPRRCFGRRRQNNNSPTHSRRMDLPSGLPGWHQLELAFEAGESAKRLDTGG
jgi:hypothetical protein